MNLYTKVYQGPMDIPTQAFALTLPIESLVSCLILLLKFLLLAKTAPTFYL